MSHSYKRWSNKDQTSWGEVRYKHGLVGTIHIPLLNTLQYLLGQIFANEMTWFSWCSCVQTHSLPYKIVSIVFSSPDNNFSYNF